MPAFEAKTSEQIPNGEVPTQQEPENVSKEGNKVNTTYPCSSMHVVVRAVIKFEVGHDTVAVVAGKILWYGHDPLPLAKYPGISLGFPGENHFPF